MSFKLRSLSEQLISSEKRRSEAEEDLKMMQNEMKKIKDENLELQEKYFPKNSKNFFFIKFFSVFKIRQKPNSLPTFSRLFDDVIDRIMTSSIE